MTSAESQLANRRRGGDGEEQRLERVLGTPALFATAYGNVGSSIYYALGVTAVFALGLTPLVFVIAGLIFAATALTYTEGTVRFPGGRRLVELRAPRVQRARQLRGRLGPDAQLHHHDRHLGVLRPALPLDLLGAAAGEPLGRRRRRDRDRPARRAERRRRPGGGEAERLPGDHRLRDAAPARHPRLRPHLQPEHPRRQRPLGASRRPGAVLRRHPGGDDRVHGDRDRLEPGRGGRATRRDIPRSIRGSRSPSSRSTSRCR